ncbi:MAG TPA: type II secretion system F family protein [Acidimicrobiales bacterium]|nr:type II secretion system F family protein [Acidimicrobiales bacterium]
MIGSLVLGAGAGTGVFLVARGLAPPRPSLAEALAQLRRVPQPAPIVAETEEVGVAARLGGPAARLLLRAGAGGLVWRRVRADLAVLGRSPERHMAEKAALAVVGLVLAPACATTVALAGLAIPLAIPAWAALACAAAGFFLPDIGIHAEAQARRADFRHALSGFLDLVVIALAGGGGVETALADAAGIGDGWAYDRLRACLDRARLARESPWAALDRLGIDLGVAELGELAASVGLAGSEGAKVRASLAAKAASLRSHQLAEAETAAQAATERMSLPVVLLFAGFLCFIGFPAIERVLSGL